MYKKVIPIKNFKVNLTGFQNFIKKSGYTYNELVNNNHLVWNNPFNGMVNDKSLLDLYSDSIDMSLEAIKKVNLYLDNKCSLKSWKGKIIKCLQRKRKQTVRGAM